MTIGRTLEDWANSREYSLKVLSELEKGWLACAVDSEGSIVNAARKDGSPRYAIRIYNTDLKYIKTARGYAGCGRIQIHAKLGSNKTGTNQTCYVLVIDRVPEVNSIAKQIAPLLAIKRYLAEQIIDLYKDGRFPNKHPAKPHNVRPLHPFQDTFGHFKKGMSNRPQRLYHNKEWLFEQYVIRNRSTCDIAKDFACSPEAISYMLRKFQIKRRTPSESKRWWVNAQASEVSTK